MGSLADHKNAALPGVGSITDREMAFWSTQVDAAQNRGTPTSGLRARLAAGEEALAVVILGDSTGNGTDEWVYLSMSSFLVAYPKYSVVYRLWNDADQAWDDAVGLQTGSAGATYVALPGTAGSYVSTPDSAAVSIVGDIDIRVRASADDWTPVAYQGLAAKFAAAGQRSWRFQIGGSTGQLIYEWSADGTTLISKASTVAPTVVDGSPLWVRVTHDVDNGATGNDVKFYTAPDVNGAAGTWTQLGATVTTAGVTSIFDSTSTLALGTREGTVEMLVGKVYAFELRSGLDGILVASFYAGNWPRLGSTIPSVTTETWTLLSAAAVLGAPQVTVLNGSVPGMTLSYSNDATRFPKLTPLESALAFINYGHNDSASATLTADYKTLADAIVAKYPTSGIVAVTQNPQTAPRTATQIANQVRAMGRVRSLAGAQKWLIIDAFRAITDAGGGSTYVNAADGVHTTPAGSNLWSATAVAALQSA